MVTALEVIKTVAIYIATGSALLLIAGPLFLSLLIATIYGWIFGMTLILDFIHGPPPK